MRRGGHHPRRGGGLGLFLLALQVFQLGVDNIPIVTLITLCVNVAIFLQFPPDFILPVSKACVSFVYVWYTEDWMRILTAPWYHVHDFHLYYNMSSLIWKGRKLERGLGSTTFAIIIVLFSVLTSSLTVLLAFLFSEVTEDSGYLNQCSAGFSGVLFALKVLLSHYEPGGMINVMFLRVPTSIAFWVELVVIQILVPNVSFVGHLAGILVGLAYVKGPLRYLVQSLASIFSSFDFNGVAPSRRHRYNWSGTTGGRPDTRAAWAERYTAGVSEEEQLRWATQQATPAPRYSSNPVFTPTEPSAPPFDEQPIGFVRPEPANPNSLYPDLDQVRRQRINRFS